MSDDVDKALRLCATLVHGGESPKGFSPASLQPLFSAAQRWVAGEYHNHGVTTMRLRSEVIVPAADERLLGWQVDPMWGDAGAAASDMTGFSTPIRLWEKPYSGGDWTPMIQGQIPPNASPQERRIWWDYRGRPLDPGVPGKSGCFYFVQCTQNMYIRVEYYARVADITDPRLTFFIPEALDICAYKAAADAMMSQGQGDKAQYFLAQANERLAAEINKDTHVRQQVPKRRRTRISGLNQWRWW